MCTSSGHGERSRRGRRRDGEVKAVSNGNVIYFNHDTENNGYAYLLSRFRFNLNVICTELNEY